MTDEPWWYVESRTDWRKYGPFTTLSEARAFAKSIRDGVVCECRTRLVVEREITAEEYAAIKDGADVLIGPTKHTPK